MIADLSPSNRDQFRREIGNFCDKKWLFSTLPPHHTVIYPSAVTFPVVQNSLKITPCRPCSDLRSVNRLLPKASYPGRPIGDIVDMVRCRYRTNYDFLFLDLSKAFLRLRLSGDKVLKIKSDGKCFYSDRVLFGYKHGPSSLSGHVTVLLNATFSAMTGRRIEMSSVNDFTDIIEGLVIAVYYDDVLVLGERKLVRRFKSIMQAIAVLCGSEFPEEKCDNLRKTSTPVRHLGVEWRIDRDSQLVIQCVKPDPVILDGPFVSRRLAFAHAGRYYDVLRCHATVRFIGDYIRHIFGQSPGGSRRTSAAEVLGISGGVFLLLNYSRIKLSFVRCKTHLLVGVLMLLSLLTMRLYSYIVMLQLRGMAMFYTQSVSHLSSPGLISVFHRRYYCNP